MVRMKQIGKLTEEGAGELHDAIARAEHTRKHTVADAAKRARTKAAKQSQAQGELSIGPKQPRRTR